MKQMAMQTRAAKPESAPPNGPSAEGPRHAQLVALSNAINGATPPAQRAANRTGLPDSLKAGVEALSGLSLDDVRVHRNSPKPAALQAHAYTQGRDIHLGPGQEKHLPHEAWHVVQQAQGRVKPTLQAKGVPINDDPALEREADVIGAAAMRAAPTPGSAPAAGSREWAAAPGSPMQRQANETPASEPGVRSQPAERVSNDAGAGLHTIINQLDAVARHAEQLGPEGRAKGAALQARLAKLRGIADGPHEELKADLLTQLTSELRADAPLTAPSGEVVQRLTGVEIGVRVAAAVAGLGLLVAAVRALMRPRGPGPTTSLTLLGPIQEAQASFANVTAEAHLTSLDQEVRYLIRWDAAAVPAGHHLGQQPGQASGWVPDLSPDGRPVGRHSGIGGFFADSEFETHDEARGLHWRFRDAIEQRPPIAHGNWWFCVRVVEGARILSSREIQVHWG